MEDIRDCVLPEQTLCAVRTVLANIGTGSSSLQSCTATVIQTLLNNLSHSTALSDEQSLLSSLKSLNLLLQVCVYDDEEDFNECNSELAVKSLKISCKLLQNTVKCFDATADTLCNIAHLSLVLMSLTDLAENASKLISKCANSLSGYVASENQQVDDFNPQVAVHLLTVTLRASCKREVLSNTDDFQKSHIVEISHDLVVQLALSSNDTLRAQTLITLIPIILKQEKSNAILKNLLDVSVVCDSEESLNKALTALSALCTYYLPDAVSTLTCCVERNDAFWHLIQWGLCSDSPLTRKHALYLIRRCVDCLSNAERDVSCDMFSWASSQKEKLFKWWQDICTVLEVLEERAFHLISPVLSILQDVFASCVKDNSAPKCFLVWCLTVFKRLLQHSCIYVVKWGVDTLIGDIGCDLMTSKHAGVFYPFFVETLINSLNNPQIFYEVEDGSESDPEIAELKTLEKIFVSASRSEIRKEFFSKLFGAMGTLNWAPISLFIFTKSLTNVPLMKCLDPKDTPMLKRLVARVLATQNVSIRLMSLQYLLVTVINLIDGDDLDSKSVVDLLTAFYYDGNLTRGSELWNHILLWISGRLSEYQVASWLAESAAQPDFPPVFAQMVTLLCDAGLLRNFDSLQSLFSLLSDCNSRPYVDQDAQTKCVEVIAHLVKTSQVVDSSCSQSFAKTRETILIVVKSLASDILTLLKKRLLTIDNLSAYQVATRLLKSFELLCGDKQAASIFSKENFFNSFISAAGDIVENDLLQKKINFVFALRVINIWCKSARDFNLNCVCSERGRKIFKNILDSSVLVEAPFRQTSELPPWTQEILGSVSSATFEAEWEFVSLNIFEPESVAAEIVEAVGIGLDTGGRNMLPLLLSILRNVLEKYPQTGSPTVVLRGCWSNIWEVRHKDIFYPALREFLGALFQPDVLQNSWGLNFASECGQELISSCESAWGVVGELASVLQSLHHRKPEVILQKPIRNLVVSCLVLSAVQRRDQRLMKKITTSITTQHDSDCARQLLRDDPSTFVRCTAIEIVTFLTSAQETQATEVADLLAQDLLLQTETAEARRARYFSNSSTHRIQLHVLQGLMLVEPKISEGTKETLGKWLLNRLLSENHQLSVRYLTEWLLVRICSSVPNLQNELLELVEAADIRESALCSIISTLLHFSLALQSRCSQSNRNFLSRFFESLLPLTMSQAYSVRFNAHVAILQVWEIMEKLGFAEEVKQYEISASAVRKSFYRASNKFQNHKDFYLTKFRCAEHYSLETMFYDMPRLTCMTRDEWICPDVLSKVGIREKGLLPLVNQDRGLEDFNSTATTNRRREGNATENPSQPCVQKKMVPSKWLEINELQVKALPEVLRPWRKDGGCELPSRGLVVVASLLDKPTNLGGLSRTCEIMAASLVLPKLSLASDREFQALSMSSEMWAPLSEVKPHELPSFLAEMKRLGFTLVGAEQTAKSTTLDRVKFPENTVLLLGNECEGIPSKLLPLLDVCVEIPQYGLVRSLNVHVAGALFIYEYRRQHSISNLAASFSGF